MTTEASTKELAEIIHRARPSHPLRKWLFIVLAAAVVVLAILYYRFRADEGMGTSLAAGINATSSADGWLIALADMPWMQPATITALVNQLKNGASMVAPVYQGQRGHPVGFSARWQQPLQELSGDKGARDLLANYPAELELLTTGDAGILKDIDHPQDLIRFSS